MLTKNNWVVLRITLVLMIVSGLLVNTSTSANAQVTDNLAPDQHLSNKEENNSGIINLLGSDKHSPALNYDECSGMMWTNGSIEPEIADQVQQELNLSGIQASVEARGYGETDGCDTYTQFGIDFTVTLTNQNPKGPSAQQALVDDILPILSEYGKLNLGNVKLISSIIHPHIMAVGSTTFTAIQH